MKHHAEKMRKLIAADHSQSVSRETNDERARSALRHYLAALAPMSKEPPAPMRDDLETVRSLVGNVFQASEQGILTESEAEAVLEFVVARFAERRMDRIFDIMFTPSNQDWFLIASGSHHGTERSRLFSRDTSERL